MMQQFKDYMKANQIDYTDADLAAKSSEWVKANMKHGSSPTSSARWKVRR